MHEVRFIKENGQHGYKYPVLAKDNCYIVKKLFDSIQKFSETYFYQMLAFLIDNMFGGGVFQQTPDMPMGPTVFLFSPTCSFICARQTMQGLLEKNEKKL